MPIKLWTSMLALGAILAGCGDTALERGATGGLIGAGVGEIVAGEPLAGAGVGAAAGVLTN